jgi:hypothetical protein
MSSAAVIKEVEGGLLRFWCPGCNESHTIGVGAGSGPRWGYNGNPEKPTFTPSVFVKTGHFVPDRAKDGCWCTYYKEHPDETQDYHCRQCHSFVNDGQIQFLSDCSHELANQTVPLPVWPADKEY